MRRVGRRRGPRGRASRRGLTLIEIMITVAIAAMIAGLTISSVNSLTDAALRSTALELTGATKFAYDRAIMERRTERLAIDLDKGMYWIDFTEEPFALSQEREKGREGEQRGREKKAEDEDEKQERSLFGSDEDRAKAEVMAVLEGGKAAQFAPDGEYGEPRALPSSVKITKVWSGHQDEPFTSGMAYIHFFSGGWTEPAQLELTDDDSVITLKLYPLTGRMKSYDKELEFPKAEEPDGRDEGDE